jgi:hypothetical protein
MMCCQMRCAVWRCLCGGFAIGLHNGVDERRQRRHHRPLPLPRFTLGRFCAGQRLPHHPPMHCDATARGGQFVLIGSAWGYLSPPYSNRLRALCARNSPATAILQARGGHAGPRKSTTRQYHSHPSNNRERGVLGVIVFFQSRCGGDLSNSIRVIDSSVWFWCLS